MSVCPYCGEKGGVHIWAGSGQCPGVLQLAPFTPLEAAYLLELLKPHLEYHRLLAGNYNFTNASRSKLLALEALAAKLGKQAANLHTATT